MGEPSGALHRLSWCQDSCCLKSLWQKGLGLKGLHLKGLGLKGLRLKSLWQKGLRLKGLWQKGLQLKKRRVKNQWLKGQCLNQGCETGRRELPLLQQERLLRWLRSVFSSFFCIRFQEFIW